MRKVACLEEDSLYGLAGPWLPQRVSLSAAMSLKSYRLQGRQILIQDTALLVHCFAVYEDCRSLQGSPCSTLKVHNYWAFFLKVASDFGFENLGVTELISNARLAPKSRNQYPHWPLAYWINFQGS